MNSALPVPIGEQSWWVGVDAAGRQFQCHAYFIDNGDEGILLDPGSPLTIEETLDKVAQIADLDSIGTSCATTPTRTSPRACATCPTC